MINKLRAKFIRITMAAVFAVLLLIVVVVNLVNIAENERSADAITQMLLDNGGSFGKNDPADIGKNDHPEQPPDNRFHNRTELPFSTRYFTVTLDARGEILSADLRSIASVTEEELLDYTTAILAQGKAVGWYKSYRYRVDVSQDRTLLIVLESSSARGNIYTVLSITLFVAVGAFALIFLLVALLSRRAIRPIGESYEKQKQFITDASHELKTPLTVISANAEILSMTYGQNEWCDAIRRQADSMRTLILKMIRMAKLDEEAPAFDMQPFDLSEAVYDTAMSFRSAAQARGLSLTADAPQGIRFCGDEAALRQVVSILVDNAVKYCDEGGSIEVTLARTPRRLGREKLILRVKNSFRAVNSLALDRLFDRFYRADASHSEPTGFGLGLPIGKAIVEKHGGTLAAQGEGGAIVFTASFPAKEALRARR